MDFNSLYPSIIQVKIEINFKQKSVVWWIVEDKKLYFLFNS
jgi:DNA polymerase elongation subunit (family B)